MSDWYEYTDGDVLNTNRQSPADFVDEIKMEYIRPYLPREGTILELGAGSGRLITRIGLENPKNYIIIGIDKSTTSLKIIQKNICVHNLSGYPLRSTATHIPLPGSSIDFLCSGGLLEHFEPEILQCVLNEMFRVLKRGGFVYADIVPKKRSLCRPLIRNNAWEYESNISLDTWKDLFLTTGFTNISIFSGLVIPPDFYRFWEPNNRLKYIYRFKKLIKSMDNTFISYILGFAYFVFAEKR